MKKINKMTAFGLLSLMVVSTSQAYFWQNPVSRYVDTASEFSEWEAQRARKERNLFYDHCSAIEWKQKNGEEIKDIRYLKPCEENNVQLYFEIRGGFSTVR